MVREMLSKIRQRSWEVGQSLAGDGMLLRLRNASIALVGAVAAVGLGLTLFISQLGFPAVFSGPIPDNPAKAGSVHDAIALTHSPGLAQSSPVPGFHLRTAAPGHPRHRGQSGSSGDRGGPDHIGVSPGTQQNPAGQPPVASVPAPASPTPTVEPSPSTPSPAPVAAVVESQPNGGQSTGASGGGSKPNAASTAKATNDGSGNSKGPQTSKSDSQTVSAAKPTSSSEKAGKDQSAAASPNPVAPPAAAPSGSSSPAAAKEAADSGK
jgi:hypothetical protein